jgi:hypothetical protein
MVTPLQLTRQCRHWIEVSRSHMMWCPTSAQHAPVTSPTYSDPTIAIIHKRKRKGCAGHEAIAPIASKNSCGLWQGYLQPARRRAWQVVCGVPQRLEIKGRKFLRFGDQALLLSMRVVRGD